MIHGTFPGPSLAPQGRRRTPTPASHKTQCPKGHWSARIFTEDIPAGPGSRTPPGGKHAAPGRPRQLVLQGPLVWGEPSPQRANTTTWGQWNEEGGGSTALLPAPGVILVRWRQLSEGETLQLLVCDKKLKGGSRNWDMPWMWGRCLAGWAELLIQGTPKPTHRAPCAGSTA